MVVDGLNPFGRLSSTHSICPTTLVTYNLLPWLCMKMSFCLLSLLIPGPKQLGNDIDVYLEPLENELKLTWDQGLRTYDAHSRSLFNIKAIFLWVIHDFPAYGIWLVARINGFLHALYVEGTQIQCISNVVGSVCTYDIGDIFQ